MSAEVHETSPGTGEVSWSARLQDEGPMAAAGPVRAAIEAAFENGHRRVEALVDPADMIAQRIAILSGLLREGIARGVAGGFDRIVFARLASDVPPDQPEGFRRLLNAQLPRKRAIGQMLIRSTDGRVLLCELTYKRDHDLPGGVVEVGESPREATAREVEEELGLVVTAGDLLLTDWLPPWSGWDDAVCLVFDGGVHDPSIIGRIVKQAREIRDAGFRRVDELDSLCADFTARRIHAALARCPDLVGPEAASKAPAYTESGRS